jgi:hypothetical protein
MSGVGSDGDGAQACTEKPPGRGVQAGLLADPRAAVEEELGTQLPESIEVRVVETGEAHPYHRKGRPGPFRAEDQGQPPHPEALSEGPGSPQKPLGASVGGGSDRAGGLWRENGLIFASEAGEPLDRRYITTHRFKPLLKRAGLPQIRFHGLRHTCATLLLAQNVNPKVVSEMLGHATIAITLDTYSHVLPNMQESAAKAMEDALS